VLVPSLITGMTMESDVPAAAVEARFLPLPGPRNPLVLVPVDYPQATAAAVRWAGEKVRGCGELAAQLAALGVRAAVFERPPLRLLTLTPRNDGSVLAPLIERLSSSVGEELTVAVRMPRRPNGKPVFVMLSPTGRVLGYAKMGSNLLTTALVRHEAAVLRGFDDEERLRLCFDVPRVLYLGDFNGNELLVLSALEHGYKRRYDPGTRPLRQIASRWGCDVHSLTTSPFLRQTRVRVAALPQQQAAVRIIRATGQWVSERLGDERLLFGGCHGDWTPYNMAMAGPRLSVWDWERSSANAPVGLDAIHRFVLGAGVRRRLTGRDIRHLAQRAEAIVSDLGQASRHGALIVLFAILEMAIRFEEARAVGIAVSNRFAPLLRPAASAAGATASDIY
jgi:hypothetical protein